MRRAALITGGAGVVAIVATLGGAWAWRTIVSRPDDALVEKVALMESDRCERPPHVERPMAGSFGELFASAAPVLRGIRSMTSAESEADSEKRRRVLDAELPFADMPPAWLAALERNPDAADLVLAATHAETALPAPGMSLFADPHRDLAHDGTLLLMAAGNAIAVDVAKKVSEGNADGAANECVDAFALARDAEWSSGMIGAMAGDAMLRRFAPPCGRAFDAANLETKRSALAELGRVEQGFPPFSRAIRQDCVYQELALIGPSMTGERISRLSPDARAAMFGAGFGSAGWIFRFNRGSFASVCEKQAGYSDLPLEELKAAFKSLHERVDDNRFATAGQTSYSAFAERHVRQRAWVDVIRAGLAADVYRAEKGRWPEQMSEIVEAGILPETIADRRTEKPVSLRVDGDLLTVPSQVFDDVVGAGTPRRDTPQLRFHP